jgi:hypothetical protein
MFIQTVIVTEDTLYTYVVCVSSLRAASKFRYKFKINNGSDAERVMFENAVWSCSARKCDIIESGKYDRIPFRVVRNALNNAGDLPCTLEIYKHSSYRKRDIAPKSKGF